MALQTPPSPRKDWNYDQYFLAHLNKNKKPEQEKINKPAKSH